MTYEKRMFKEWKEAILYIAIVMVIPLLPIIVFVRNNSNDLKYYHVLVLCVSISFAYEFIKKPINNCTFCLKLEYIICSVFAVISSTWTLVLLTLCVNDSNKTTINFCDYLPALLFFVPLIIVIFEIIKVIIHTLQESRYPLPERNLAKGAKNV